MRRPSHEDDNRRHRRRQLFEDEEEGCLFAAGGRDYERRGKSHPRRHGQDQSRQSIEHRSRHV